MLIKWREGEQSRRFAGVFGAGIVRVALSTCWRASWSSGIRLHQRNQTFPLSFPDEPRARPADPTPAEESGDSSPMPECCTTSLCPSIPVLLACRPRSSDPEPENRQMQISLRQLSFSTPQKGSSMVPCIKEPHYLNCTLNLFEWMVSWRTFNIHGIFSFHKRFFIVKKDSTDY